MVEKKEEEKTILIKQSELAELLEMNRQLMAKIQKESMPTVVTKAIKERKVTIMFIGDKAVTGYVNKGIERRPSFIYDSIDPKDPKERILYVDLILNGDVKNPVKVNYLEFLQEADRQELLVKKINEEPWIQDTGKSVEAQEVKEGEWSPTSLGMRVPLVVEGKTRSFVVAMPDGTEREFDERYVNISK